MVWPVEGFLSKMKGMLVESAVEYTLMLEREVSMNALVGQRIQLEFRGEMQCVSCHRVIKKTFQQGHCFPCTQTKAACDLCIVRPERCHFSQGTCREPEWGRQHCMQQHVVYLSNTSGLKVGITRRPNIPQRFIDQGAIQALPVFEVESRYHSGLVEVLLATHFADKTNWRAMLQGHARALNLIEERDKLNEDFREELNQLALTHSLPIKPITAAVIELQYPVLNYPLKVTSLSLDKTPCIEDKLEGIKGQYLIFTQGVFNVRNFSGYKIRLTLI